MQQFYNLATSSCVLEGHPAERPIGTSVAGVRWQEQASSRGLAAGGLAAGGLGARLQAETTVLRPLPANTSSVYP